MAFGITAVVLAAGAAIYSGEVQKDAAKKAAKSAKQARRMSLLASIKQDREAATAEKKANRRKPDVASLLLKNQQAGAGTVLAGKGAGGASLLGSKGQLG